MLSGFLIANSIQSRIKNKNFNLIEFYLRRAARIFPASITVLVVVWFVGRQVLFPEELSELAKSITSFLMLKNNFWAAESISYFGIELNQKPLIHYWSLTIEIQFYIVFPFIVRGFLRANNRNLLLVILIAILMVSFIYTYINAPKNLEKAYFSSVMRVWEFTLGATASMLIFPKNLTFENTIMQNFVPMVGYSLIIGSFFLLDNRSGFPGALALFPCVGTVLILWGSQRNLFINKLFINWTLENHPPRQPQVSAKKILAPSLLPHDFYRKIMGQFIFSPKPRMAALFYCRSYSTTPKR
ncbi:MAG: acyltransferase [Cellvibrio sp.]|nr:acyltransferase [Cellvibrio sp.]